MLAKSVKRWLDKAPGVVVPERSAPIEEGTRGGIVRRFTPMETYGDSSPQAREELRIYGHAHDAIRRDALAPESDR